MFRRLLFIICLSSFWVVNSNSQEVYSKSSMEFLFSFADVDTNSIGQSTGLRFSFFFNYGQHWHMDLSKHIGLYTGGNIRNIGFKLKEGDSKQIFRAYSLGIPLALKLGSFQEHMYFYGGGEYELFFHYKHKKIHNGEKDKNTSWFSNRNNLLMPSVFAGIQFPKGLNLRFSYYLKDFLNKDFSGTSFGEQVDYGQWKTQVFYISLSLNFKTSKYKEMINKTEGEMVKL